MDLQQMAIFRQLYGAYSAAGDVLGGFWLVHFSMENVPNEISAGDLGPSL